jgi:glycosyltransferase involved in cell wall biosynthesis
VLAIGHSYTIAMNRSIVREVARDPAFHVTVAAPRFFHGDLRPVTFDAEPPDSLLTAALLDASATRFIHIFRYDDTSLRALIRQGNFDVIHAWEEPYVYAGYQIARAAAEVPARFCFRTAQSLIKWYPPPFDFFERTVLKHAQGWIAGASLVHRAMLERGFPAERGRVLTLAVDTGAFKPLRHDDRQAVLRELALTAPVIGYVGRLTAEKGLDVLMEALELVPPSTHWSLLLLGSGPYEQRVLQWAAQRGWSDRVRIVLAKHNEVPRYLGCMDVLVAPSRTTKRWREQFGRMVIEAFASGVPVVGSDSGEIPFVIGDAGRVVPEHDAAAYATTLAALLDSPAERAALVARGFERLPRFSASTIAAQYRQYYRWLAEQPKH